MNTTEFRAWDKDNSRMVMPDAFFIFTGSEVLMLNPHHADSNYYQIDNLEERFIQMQFADLEDRDGKSFDWWEGDILHLSEKYEDESHASVIVKKDGCFMAQFYEHGKPYLNEEKEELFVSLDSWMKDSRVKVGNIYEHPEKLKP